MENIELELKKILSRISLGKIPAQEIQMTDSLQMNLGLDSLAIIELLVAIEETFGIRMSDEDLLNQDQWMQTVNSVFSFVTARLASSFQE